jgi:hypothetical protein
MMHYCIEAHCAACERAIHRRLKSLGEDPLTAIGMDTAEPAGADGQHNTPSLRWKIGQCSPIAAWMRADTVPQTGHAAVVLTGVAAIRNVSASVSMLLMARPHGASVIPRPMTAIPYRFAAHSQGKLHQH